MSRRESSRERILDAFEELLTEDGERIATLDAVAAKAGVSKGGLLYHFASKDALVQGLLERLSALVADDVQSIRTAPEGAIEYLLRTSVASDSPLERTIMACLALAQGANEEVRAALRQMQDAWFDVVAEAVGDPVRARVISLVSDGLYFNSVLRQGDEAIDQQELDEVVAFVARMARG
ncbi:TetR/AcrR family transcriptional regulator [Humibacter antri]